MDDNDQLEAGGHATAAREHVYGFNRATMWERDQIPAEASDQLAEFADLAAALPPRRSRSCPARLSRPSQTRCSAWMR